MAKDLEMNRFWRGTVYGNDTWTLEKAEPAYRCDCCGEYTKEPKDLLVCCKCEEKVTTTRGKK
jgi:Zn finger protein HypA/HybF involved in hydrogenase expression